MLAEKVYVDRGADILVLQLGNDCILLPLSASMALFGDTEENLLGIEDVDAYITQTLEELETNFNFNLIETTYQQLKEEMR